MTTTVEGSAFDPLATDAPGVHEGLVRLRAEAPVSRCPNQAWFLARHDDVLAATKDVETFRASLREPGLVVPDEEQFVNEIPEPRHGHVRRIIDSAIAEHRIGRVEPIARDLCGRLLDALLADGGGDMVADYSVPIPTTVIGHLLGAPVEDHRRWAEWSDEVVQGTYPTRYRNERGVGLAGAHPEFTAYVDEQIRIRRTAADPPDDFITRLLVTEVDGRRLTDVGARTQLVFLFLSGNETTRHLVSNLEARVAVETLLDRVGSMRLAPDYVFEKVPVSWAYGPSRLPVDLTPATGGAGA